MACEASARTMSLSVIPPTAFEQDPDRHFLVRELFEFLGQGFDRPLNVGLQDQVQALELLLGHLGVEVFERDRLAIGVSSVAGAGAASLGDLAGAGNVLDDGEVLAGRGYDVQTRDFDRSGRPGLLDRASLVVEDGTNPAETVAADDHVADPQGSFADQNRSQDAAALRERRFEARAGRRPGRVGLELVKLGDRFQRRQQLGDAQSARRRSLDDLGFATPLGRMQPLLRELAVNLVDVRRRSRRWAGRSC